MLKSLSIKNFQSHKDTHLDFSPGVNVIVGDSDKGKSSILRALRWVIFNQPGGDEFRSWYGGDPEVTLEIGDKTITRFKSKTENTYVIDNDPRFRFEAFRTGVPTEIQQILNLNDINIQRQFEGHFLLSNTSGEVAQHFNRVAHLTEIDKGLSNIRSLIDSIQRKIKSTEEDIKVKKIKLQSFDYLPRFEQEVEKLENLQIQTTRKEQQLNSLTLLLDSIFNVEEELEEESKILTLEPEINKIISFIQSRDETTTRIIKLRNLIEQIEDLEIDIKSYERILSTESLVNNISNWIEKQNKLDKSIRTLGNLVKNIESTETELINIEERIRNLEKQFHELMPDICPLCGSNLKKR